MIGVGDSFGIETLFNKEHLSNLTVKVVDDCVFFAICRSTLQNVLRKIISIEYMSNFQITKLLFKGFSAENKEKISFMSTQHNILSQKARASNPGSDQTKADSDDRECVIKFINNNISENQILKTLRKIISCKFPDSKCQKSNLNQMISNFVIKAYNKGQVIEFGQEKTVAFLIKGEVHSIDENRQKTVLKEGEMFSNSQTTQFISFTASCLGQINYEIFQIYIDSPESKIPLPIEKENIPEEKKTKEPSFNNLFYVRELGEGQFGRVILVKDEEFDEFYALKCISKRQKYFDEIRNLIEDEKNILKTLNFPLIVQYKGYYEDEFNCYIMMEYIKGIELFELIRTKPYLLVKHCQFYAASLILILEYLHNNNIIYRDLKPENIMIDHEGNLKLVDLGSCKTNGKNPFSTSLCGTPHYMSPEMISGKGYDGSIDIWALGVILFEMRCGFLPFGMNSDADHDIYTEILKKELEIPYDVETPLRELLEKLLKKDPHERLLSFEEIKKSEWFSDFDWNDLLFKKMKTPFVPRTYKENLISLEKLSQFFQDEESKRRRMLKK